MGGKGREKVSKRSDWKNFQYPFDLPIVSADNPSISRSEFCIGRLYPTVWNFFFAVFIDTLNNCFVLNLYRLFDFFPKNLAHLCPERIGLQNTKKSLIVYFSGQLSLLGSGSKTEEKSENAPSFLLKSKKNDFQCRTVFLFLLLTNFPVRCTLYSTVDMQVWNFK